MYDFAPSGVVGAGRADGAIQLDSDIKTVVKVYPSTMRETFFSDHPMWVLLGFITLDRHTQDLMQLTHTYEGYRIYLGTDFRWKWERSTDSDVGGWLYLQNTPRDSSNVAVVGLKRILENEDIADEFILDWILQYTKALVQIMEGNVLRKGQIIGIQQDGQNLLDEGLRLKEELQERLKKEARWAMLAIRK
jgi:hypothetical protein